MLPKKWRLTQNFSVIFQKGVKEKTPFFVVRAIPAFDGHTRLAVIVSKKTEKTAVGRNKVRRRLLEAAWATGFFQKKDAPLRIAIIGFSAGKEALFTELVTTMKKALEKAEQKTKKKEKVF